MTINSYSELLEHSGHVIGISTYGGENAVIECDDCSEILIEFMNPEYEEVYSWNPEDSE